MFTAPSLKELRHTGIMDPERWQQIDKLLEEVLERPREQRRAFLDTACTGDESLRKEVEALLAAHERQEGVLDSPALEVAARGITAAKAGSLVGHRLGPYQIVSFLGAGGMGEVYKARDTRLDRLDALKILPSEVAADRSVCTASCERPKRLPP